MAGKFQYQPLHEGLQKLSIKYVACCISIPAPPRGASLVSPTEHCLDAISIPAPPRGASLVSRPTSCTLLFQYQPLHEGLLWPPRIISPYLFQYQPLHEGLHRVCILGHDIEYFNTSPSTRGFADGMSTVASSFISIPAPPRGASRG